MKSILPVMAVLAAATVFASPALACERHAAHAATAAAEPAPVPVPKPATVMVVEPAAAPNPTMAVKTEETMSRPLGAAYEGCNRRHKDQTVYLTQ